MIITKEFIRNNKGCYSEEKLNNCSFMKQEEFTLENILNSEISLKNKFWFVCKKLNTKEQNQQISILVAETILFLYELKYPEDKRPREAIEAAKNYLKGSIDINEFLLKRYAAANAAYAAAAADAAAYAAYAAANAAYAAANAAYAAAAADAAAYAAANAAYAAANAAYAAAYAAANAAYAAAYAADAAAYAANAADAGKYISVKENLLFILKEFCKENHK